jgi:hypothetical protein
VTVFVHQDLLCDVSLPALIRFNFGVFGWCELTVIDAAVGAPPGRGDGHA